jgi:outer membrane protein
VEAVSPEEKNFHNPPRGARDRRRSQGTMKFPLRSLVALSVLFSGLLPAQETARLKIATVDMQALFQEFHQTKTTKTKFEEEQARVVKDRDERIASLKGLESEIEVLKKQEGDPSVADAKKQAIFTQRQTKQQEFDGLRKELEEFIQRKARALNEQMQVRMKSILEEIRAKVQKHAEDGGYDYVLDKTGTSTSQVPILLYTKDATDITEVLLKTINAGAPAPVEAPKTGGE